MRFRYAAVSGILLCLCGLLSADDLPPKRGLSFEQWEAQEASRLYSAINKIEVFHRAETLKVDASLFSLQRALNEAQAQLRTSLNGLEMQRQYQLQRLGSAAVKRGDSALELEKSAEVIEARFQTQISGLTQAWEDGHKKGQLKLALLSGWKEVLEEQRKVNLAAVQMEWDRRVELAKAGKLVSGEILLALAANDYTAPPARLVKSQLAESEIPPGTGWQILNRSPGHRLLLEGNEVPADASWVRRAASGGLEFYIPLKRRWEEKRPILEGWVSLRESRAQDWHKKTGEFIAALESENEKWESSEHQVATQSPPTTRELLLDLIHQEAEQRKEALQSLKAAVEKQKAFRLEFANKSAERVTAHFMRTGEFDVPGLDAALQELDAQVAKFQAEVVSAHTPREQERRKSYLSVAQQLERLKPLEKAAAAWLSQKTKAVEAWYAASDAQRSKASQELASWDRSEQKFLEKVGVEEVHRELTVRHGQELAQRKAYLATLEQRLSAEKQRRLQFLNKEYSRLYLEGAKSGSREFKEESEPNEAFRKQNEEFEESLRLASIEESTRRSTYEGVEVLSTRYLWLAEKKAEIASWAAAELQPPVKRGEQEMAEWTRVQDSFLENLKYSKIKARLAKKLESEKKRRQSEWEQKRVSFEKLRQSLIEAAHLESSADSREKGFQQSFTEAKAAAAELKALHEEQRKAAARFPSLPELLQQELARYPLPYAQAPQWDRYRFGLSPEGNFLVWWERDDGQPHPLLSLREPLSIAHTAGHLAVIGRKWSETEPALKLVILADDKTLVEIKEFKPISFPRQVYEREGSFLVAVSPTAEGKVTEAYLRSYDPRTDDWDFIEYQKLEVTDFFLKTPE